MYIGEASRKSGLSVKAIRFYEAKGLIKPPGREGRYRVFSEADVELLALIREARELGVSLSQLRQVIAYNHGVVDWANIKYFLQQYRSQLVNQIEEINQKIASLDACYRQINA